MIERFVRTEDSYVKFLNVNYSGFTLKNLFVRYTIPIDMVE